MTNYETDNQFLNEAWSIEQNIDRISNNIKSIGDIQARIVVAVATIQESSLAQERDQLLYNTKSILFETKENIKKLAVDNLKFKRDNPNHPEIGIRTQRQEYVKQKFTKALEAYRDVENDFMRQQKERMSRQYKVVNPDATQAEIDSYLKDPSDQPVFATALLRTGEAKDALAEVRKRHNDIRQIEQNIAELAELFNELNLQVAIQDETLVTIEQEVAETNEKIIQSTQQLGKATNYAMGARRKKWYCLGIVIVVAIIIVAVVIILVKK